MLIAEIKLPEVLPIKVFNTLSQYFNNIKEGKDKRVFEENDYFRDRKIPIIMNKGHYFEDECIKTEDGEWYFNDVKVESYKIHKRPKEVWVPLKNNIVILDIEKLYSVVSDIHVEVLQLINIKPTDVDFMNKIENLSKKLDIISNNNMTFNQKCEVHVPNLGLLMINKVCVEEDCCTDHLQDMLKNGWRILAICPQPDQRRPDYILGKNDLTN